MTSRHLLGCLMQLMTALRVLIISGCPRVTIKALSELPARCPEFRQFGLAHLPVSDDVLRLIGEGCKRVESLDLSYTPITRKRL